MILFPQSKYVTKWKTEKSTDYYFNAESNSKV